MQALYYMPIKFNEIIWLHSVDWLAKYQFGNYHNNYGYFLIKVRHPMPPKILYPVVLTTCLLITLPVVFAETRTDINLESTTKKEPAPSKMKSTDMEKPRGQLLYETHCNACHGTSVHSRNPRKAKSIGDIKHWVTRWSKELKLDWSSADIDDVAKHVNSKYYHFK